MKQAHRSERLGGQALTCCDADQRALMHLLSPSVAYNLVGPAEDKLGRAACANYRFVVNNTAYSEPTRGFEMETLALPPQPGPDGLYAENLHHMANYFSYSQLKAVRLTKPSCHMVASSASRRHGRKLPNLHRCCTVSSFHIHKAAMAACMLDHFLERSNRT